MDIRPLAALLAATCVPLTAEATPPFSRLVVFGDSLSDVGNIDAMTQGVIPGEPYFEGRFSNGPVWIEELAEQFSVPVPAFSISGGTNYAFGGARTGTGFTNFIIPNMGQQVSLYLSQGPPPASGDLFVLLGGANDFFQGESDPTIVVSNLIARIVTLANAGAEDFLVLGLPPLGQTPGSVGTPQEPLLDGVIESFNDAYADALGGMQASLGVTIRRFDLNHEFQVILEDPEAAGFTVVDQPAYDETTGAIPPDADTYLFWDDIHPTGAAHSRLGRRVHGRYACPADVNVDGTVDVNDLVAVVTAYGDSGFALPEDVVGSGVVNVDDLVAVVVAWGACP